MAPVLKISKYTWRNNSKPQIKQLENDKYMRSLILLILDINISCLFHLESSYLCLGIILSTLPILTCLILTTEI